MMLQEEEQKKIESIKLKEWEEKFDREQKLKEQKEILKDQKLRQRELNELNSNDTNISNELSSKLENFEIDKTSEH